MVERSVPRLNLPAIEASLRDMQRNKYGPEPTPPAQQLKRDEQILTNLLEGYRLINHYATNRIELFEMGGSPHILEINHTVLFGPDRADRECRYKKKLLLSEQQFYEQPGGGISGLTGFMARNNYSDPRHLAAALYVYLLAQPQLFIEGNHRTGSLLMSYILQVNFLPPIVLSRASADDFFTPSNQIARHLKNSFSMWLGYPKLRRFYAAWIEEHAEERFLLR